jgi:hypothetical protein
MQPDPAAAQDVVERRAAFAQALRALDIPTLGTEHNKVRRRNRTALSRTALRAFYVYRHVDPFTQEVFYIGKGRDGRAWDVSSRTPDHRGRLRGLHRGHRFGAWVEIVKEHLTEAEALAYESSLIMEARSRGVKLYNRTRT